MQLLPKYFCWTRFGTEAGEAVDAILARKEMERRQNGGVFLWGIGNAIGPSMRELLKREPAPEVIFSPMLAPPKRIDVEPPAVVVWHSGRDLDGCPVALPEWSSVRSRASAGGRANRHYALVCFTDSPLVVSSMTGAFSVGRLQNLLTRRPVGASQVTAVVQCGEHEQAMGATYRVALRARLVAPFFVQLTDPQPFEGCGRRRSSALLPHAETH